MINPQPVRPQRSPYSNEEKTGDGLPASPHPITPDAQPKKRSSQPWKKVLGVFLCALLVGASAYGISTYLSLKRNIIVADRDTKDAAILSYDPAKQTPDPGKFTALGDGRFNIVFVGIDKAAGLTDSIQVLSIDTINKTASMTSIPRDLYVDVPGYGYTKINAAYNIGEAQQKGQGSAMLKEVVGKVIGTTITNYALTDFSGLEDIVNSVGGIDVNVPKAINDPFFPADTGNGYAPFSISAGEHHLDGHTALTYARSRETTSDFDRSARQQLIIEAIRTKALSAGVLTNPLKINSILTDLGQSFRTDLQLDQIKSLISLYDSIPASSKKDYTLDTSTAEGLLNSSTNTAAGYISYPVLGFSNYAAIQGWFHQNNPDPLLTQEAPTVTLANGGKATPAQMQSLDTLLTQFGYKVTLDSTYLAKSTVSSTTVYATKPGSKPITQNYLGTEFNTSVQPGSPLNSGSDFEIIYAPSSATTPTPTLQTVSPSPSPTPSITPSPSPSVTPSDNPN